MEQVLLKNEEGKQSLLRQIVDEADALDETGKAAILRKIKLQKALESAKLLDEALERSEILVKEEEIADLISAYRKDQYEKSLHS
ncbi:hypothetical protein BH11BAC6_BH11BAC6_07010 [soil metagenome]